MRTPIHSLPRRHFLAGSAAAAAAELVSPDAVPSALSADADVPSVSGPSEAVPSGAAGTPTTPSTSTVVFSRVVVVTSYA